MTRPILYSFRRCPYAMRARLAIEWDRLRIGEILLRDKPQAMLEASPRGQCLCWCCQTARFWKKVWMLHSGRSTLQTHKTGWHPGVQTNRLLMG